MAGSPDLIACHSLGQSPAKGASSIPESQGVALRRAKCPERVERARSEAHSGNGAPDWKSRLPPPGTRQTAAPGY